MDELKADAPLEVYSLTREEMEILVVSQRRRIKQLESAIKLAAFDVETAKVSVNDIGRRLKEKSQSEF